MKELGATSRDAQLASDEYLNIDLSVFDCDKQESERNMESVSSKCADLSTWCMMLIVITLFFQQSSPLRVPTSRGK